MLLIDKGELNPTMILRWQKYLESPQRPHDRVWGPWRAMAELPPDEFAEAAAEIIQPTRSGQVNPLVREALSSRTSPRRWKRRRDSYAKLLVRINEKWLALLAAASDGETARGARRSGRRGVATGAVRRRRAARCAAGARLGILVAVSRSPHARRISKADQGRGRVECDGSRSAGSRDGVVRRRDSARAAHLQTRQPESTRRRRAAAVSRVLRGSNKSRFTAAAAGWSWPTRSSTAAIR